jgi:3-methyladenine DNA glycosylase AlkD
MNQPVILTDANRIAAAVDAELRALPVQNTPNERAVRRKYSLLLRSANADFVLDVARNLLEERRGFAYELIAARPEALRSIGEAELEEFGQGIHSWESADSFARTLAGPVWLRGQVDDELMNRWARSEDRWWRRAALVSTVALNVRSHGGKGDARRTLAVCRLLAADHDDMVAKALSWALRELVVHDAQAVRDFLDQYDAVLPARVKREVRHKLATGLKNPRPNRLQAGSFASCS